MIDFLIKLLFESLPLLLVVEAIALAVALAAHRRRFTLKTRRGLWITLAACVLLVAVQKMVVTDRERLAQLIEELAHAVDEGNIPAIAERLDPDFGADFRHQHQDKAAFLADVNTRLQRWQVDQAKVFNFQINVDRDTATVAFSGTCDVRTGDQVQYDLLSMWKLKCVRRPQGWRLAQILSAKVGPGGMLNLADAWNY